MERNDTALTGVRMMIADGIVTQEAAEKYFPELRESEDEKILRVLKKGFQCYKNDEWCEGITNTQILAWLEKQGEKKPAVKVEPKFNKGDIVVDKWGHIFEITRIGKDYNGITYSCSLLENPMFWSLYYEDEIRKWDIVKDAKAGDVLCWDDSKCIALFKNIYDNESFESYGFVGHRTGIFQPSESYHDIKDAHPATKEQRDVFFAKMREAGYEWDAEKLELKKI